MPAYNPILLTVDAAETRRYAGLQRAKDFSENMIVEACREALLLIDSKALWQEYDYDAIRQEIVVEKERFVLTGRNIGKHLSSCEKVFLLAVTVGDAIENEIDAKFKRGEYAAAILLDAAATAAVEQAADETEKALRRCAAKEGFFLRRRFSPGYGDWSLAAQRDITHLCCAEEIGIILSEGLMLTPRKSITAVVGLSRTCTDEKAKISSAGKCAGCSKTDCPSRIANERQDG